MGSRFPKPSPYNASSHSRACNATEKHSTRIATTMKEQKKWGLCIKPVEIRRIEVRVYNARYIDITITMIMIIIIIIISFHVYLRILTCVTSLHWASDSLACLSREAVPEPLMLSVYNLLVFLFQFPSHSHAKNLFT